METKNFNDLYKKIWGIRVNDFPPSALSELLHGYLSVYSMVRVHPWLEASYGPRWEIYERIREIARLLSRWVKDPSIGVEERVSHVADLMDTYLLYSDMVFLNTALDAAYGILSPEGSGEFVLPCRTPEMCRMLCSCYYFANEEECAVLAGKIVEEENTILRGSSEMSLKKENAWKWCRAMEFYENTVGDDSGHEKTEWLRREFDASRQEALDGIHGDVDINRHVLYFDVLATREYELKLRE